ncbi:MAG: Phage tail assembly chaperone protein, or 41 or 14 [Burkholderiaceae bacterium]|nr:Phage tail assembly chaperone protein, or 41 or 14 [Burkholderiaceae bacterium]
MGNTNYAAKIDLDYPLNTPSGAVSTITLRRGKAKDVSAAQRIEPNDPARRELVLISLLTQEKLTVEDIEELDLADLAEVQSKFQGLFVRGARQQNAVGNEGAAGPVVPVPTV